MSGYTYETLSTDCRIYTSKEHTFGTDAFLLADFAKARRKDTVVDLGTGCGIIAVLIKLRYGSADVWGVDIMPQAIDQFEQTVRDSSLENVHPVLADIKAIDSTLPLGRCDLVTCNPPYKAAGAGIISDTDAEKAARHETMCTIDDICAASARLLRYGGRLCLC
ncbi:MAG: methyltransferase, partial [Oscillospiraceae bacterium]|nr:methyltransferase [Oscillospiraceae bacterium]